MTMAAFDWSVPWPDKFPLLIQMYVQGWLFIQTGGHNFYGKTYKFKYKWNNSKNCNIYFNGHQKKIMFINIYFNIFYVY